jgi:hypothetical protein
MSGRPRLIQEGEPIPLSIKTAPGNPVVNGGKNHNEPSNNGHSLSSSTTTYTTIGNGQPVNHYEGGGGGGGGGGSSLQRAARNSLLEKDQQQQQHHTSIGNTIGHGSTSGSKQKTTTSFVIGAVENNSGTVRHSNTYVDSDHLRSSTPPLSQHHHQQQQQTTYSIERKQHFTIVSSNPSSSRNTVDRDPEMMDDSNSHIDEISRHSDVHFHESSCDMEAEPIRDDGTSRKDGIIVHQNPMLIANNASDRTVLPHHSSNNNNNMSVVAVAQTGTGRTQTSYVIGGSTEQQQQHGSTLAHTLIPSHVEPYDDRPLVRMEGVEDLGTKLPLIVLDGANVAYAYGTALSGLDAATTTAVTNHNNNFNNKPEPDVQGIKVATDYFQQAGFRVLVVLPQYWLQSKPRSGDSYHYGTANSNTNNNAKMETPQLEILNDLKAKGLIVASPPTDDDDAYALTIARREEARSLKLRQGEGPGFVLSNDLFRDAQLRDGGDVELRDWLKEGRHKSVGPGRISYTFGDMGTMNDRGEKILDFVPNPRHPLIVWMETNTIVDGYATT